MQTEQINSLSLIKISGDDATSFLQGQLTNDISLLSNNWQFAGYCNPKGRLLALLQIWCHGDAYYALLANDLVESTMQRLRMYVMRSKVTIKHVKAATLHGVFSHPQLQALDNQLAKVVAADSETENLTVTHGDTTALIINTRYLLIKQNGNSVGDAENQWQTMNVSEGLPYVGAASTELFIPQMLNLDVLKGISFKKGCYTGQEIVARMHYLGKLKQRMFVCDATDNTAQIGDKIFIDPSNGKTVGTVVNVASNRQQLLAVLRLENKDDCLYLDDGGEVTVASTQPYALES